MSTKVREITWPDEFSDLKRIEEFMVCGICYEYMDTTVITPCSHNYCSLCIRKYLHFKTQCPACFQNFFEKDLYINRAMDGLIQHYLQVREKLISLMENRVIYNTVIQQKQETPSTPPVRPVRTNQTPKSPVISITENQVVEPKTPITNLSSANVSNSSPSTSKPQITVPSIAKIFSTPKRKDVVPQTVNVNVKTVSCPVCKVDISEQHINVHLDACLKRESTQGAPKEKIMKSKRPPLPKLVLRVMKDAELRKKLKEFGLSIQGDRRALENRFTRYSTIYNAECDKVEPRPIPDLIRQCEMEEKQERKMDSFLIAAPTTNRLQIDRNAKEEKIEEAQKNYREANKSSFDKLIEEVRKRQQMKQEQENDSKKSDSIPSTSTSVKKVLDSDKEENTLGNSPIKITYQDSDSDEPCPLQHYINNVNDSSPCTSTSGSPVKKIQTNSERGKQMKKCVVSKNDDIYNLSTELSTDEDVPLSPVLKKRINRKKTKISSKTLDSSVLSTSTKPNKNVVERENKQAEARNLCDSILHDFSFDDSSNEFQNKPRHKILNEETNDPSNNSLNNFNLKKGTTSSCNTEQSNVESNLNSELSKSFEDFLHPHETDNSSNLVNKNTTKTKEVPAQKLVKTLNSCVLVNSVENDGKENDGISINGSSQNSLKVDTVARRPLRKRSRPLRYAENSISYQEGKEKSLHQSEDNASDDLGSPDNCKSSVSADGSLKRRRGRPKVHTAESSEEQQNPPKRPVRRRQTATDPSLC